MYVHCIYPWHILFYDFSLAFQAVCTTFWACTVCFIVVLMSHLQAVVQPLPCKNLPKSPIPQVKCKAIALLIFHGFFKSLLRSLQTWDTHHDRYLIAVARSPAHTTAIHYCNNIDDILICMPRLQAVVCVFNLPNLTIFHLYCVPWCVAGWWTFS